jgi:hypothetical protein
VVAGAMAVAAVTTPHLTEDPAVFRQNRPSERASQEARRFFSA